MLPSGIYNTANFWFFFINMYHTIVLRNEMKKIDLSFFFCAEKIFFLVVFFYLLGIYLFINYYFFAEEEEPVRSHKSNKPQANRTD